MSSLTGPSLAPPGRWRRWAHGLASVVLMAVAAGFALSVTQSGSQDTTAATKDSRTVLQSVLGSLSDQYLQFMAKALDDSTNAPWTLRPGSPADRARLRQLVATSPFINAGAGLVDLTGAPITVYTRGGWPATSDPGLASLRAGLLAGQPGLSGALTSTPRPSVALAVPVMRAGRPVALLVGLTDLASSQLQQYVAGLQVGKGATSYVLDGRGLAVAASDPALLGHHPPGLPPLAGGGTRATVYRVGGHQQYLSYTKLIWGGWVTANAQPTATFLGPVRSDWFRIELVLFLILTAGAAWFAWLNQQRVAALRELAQSALLDPLTALPNRAAFGQRMEQLAAQAGEGGRFAVLFVDLDRFKLVNDTHGHLVGDELLVAVGDRLQQALREEDFLARLSGDEFGVLVANAGTLDRARGLAQRLLAALEEPFVLTGGVSVVARASVGVALTDGSDAVEDALRDADLAMYAAKEAGGQVLRVFEVSMAAASRRRLELEHQLRAGIPAGQLLVHYQPIFELTSGRPVAVEALVRWNHPTRGLLLPADFLDVAADSELVCSVGDWVREQALERLARWRAALPAGDALGLSLNVSPRELRRGPRFVADVRRSLRRWAVAPQSLELELSESVLSTDIDEILPALEGFCRLGVRLAMDDFGAGQSTLAHITRWPLSCLKLDRTLVADAVTGERGRAVVESVLQLAEALGLTVVAEGIETPEQLRFLTSLGCARGQGFLLAPPLPAPECEAVLRAGPRSRPPVPVPRASGR